MPKMLKISDGSLVNPDAIMHASFDSARKIAWLEVQGKGHVTVTGEEAVALWKAIHPDTSEASD